MLLGDYISSDPRPYGQMLFVALVKGNWDDLMKKFCEWFFPLSKVQYNHTGYIFGKESAGDIIRKLFEEKEEEIDLDEVLEVKRIMRVKSES